MKQEIIDMFQLKDYQVQAADFVLSRPSAGLFLKMGLGKTRIALACVCEANLPCHVLVIAPAAIARTSWVDEINDLNLPLRHMSLVTGPRGGKLPKKKRLERYEALASMPPTVCFLSRDLVTDIVKYFKDKRQAFPFGFVVIDELQSFKNYSSERFKALKSVRGQIQHVLGLTGTPAPNGVMDLWAQIYLIDAGQRFGPYISHFRDDYFTPGVIVNGYPVTWNPRPGAEDEIQRLVAEIAISMDNSMLTLPDLTINDMRCYMDDTEKDMYKKLMKTNVLELDNADIVACNAAVLAGKLLQLASGNIYTDDQHNYQHIHSKKLELLQYIYDNEPNPILVAYIFQTDVIDIRQAFPEAVVFDGKPKTLKAWNRKQIRMLLIQPASAGFGLNFQYGGSTLVWYTLPWSLEQYQQTNSRLYRQNQSEPVVIHRLVTAGTIDERILKVLEQKDASQEKLLEAVKLAIND